MNYLFFFFTQIETLGESDWDAPSPVSQFVSLDAEGTLLFWSTLINNNNKDSSNTTFDDYMTVIKNETINNNNNNYSNNNSTNNSTKGKNNNTNNIDASSLISTNQFGLSPSGRISLIVTKVIRKQFNITKNIFANVTVTDSNNSSNKDTNNTKNRNSSTNTNNNNNNQNQNSLNNLFLNGFQSTDISVLCPIPNDISTLLLSGNHGKVSKIVRFGEPSNPKDFRRPEIGKMEISVTARKNGR